MASPQIEQGYTKIANELLAALAKANLAGSDFMVCLAVISKTYGWNKTKDQISISQFEILTKLARRTVIRSVQRLIEYKVLTSVTGGTGTGKSVKISSTYWIQKDYDKWNIPTSVTNDTGMTSVTNDTRTSVICGKRPVSQMTPTKDNTKDILNTAKTSKPKTVFTKPTVAQIAAYCQERQNSIDPQYFFDKMEIVDWVYGKYKTPVKSWKAVIRTWESYGKINSSNESEQLQSTMPFGAT